MRAHNRLTTCEEKTHNFQNLAPQKTNFEGGHCSQIANRMRVEVQGTRQPNNSVPAKAVESD